MEVFNMNNLSNKAFLLGALCLGFVGLAQVDQSDFKSSINDIVLFDGIGKSVLRTRLMENMDLLEAIKGFAEDLEGGVLDVPGITGNGHWQSKDGSFGQHIEWSADKKTVKLETYCQHNQYKISICEDSNCQHVPFKINTCKSSKKQIISFSYEGRFDDVQREIYNIFREYVKFYQQQEVNKIANVACAGFMLESLKQAGIVGQDITIESVGFLRKAWNAITSKWVTIPVVACAGLVALCVAFDGE